MQNQITNFTKLSLDEKLYRRFPRLVNGSIEPGAIAFPDISVNRASLSNPDDLLINGHENEGVCSFLVSDIPTPLTHPNTGEVFEFYAVERPIQNNPSHAEIIAFQNSNRVQKEPPKLIRTEFRALLLQRLQIERRPK